METSKFHKLNIIHFQKRERDFHALSSFFEIQRVKCIIHQRTTTVFCLFKAPPSVYTLYSRSNLIHTTKTFDYFTVCWMKG